MKKKSFRSRLARFKVKNNTVQNKHVQNQVVPSTNSNTNKKVDLSFIKTGEGLINRNIEKLPFLWDGIFPESGVVAVSGSSDTGKSSFLRQFAIAVVLGLADFLGIKLNPRHKRVLIVSTEDDATAIAYLLKKQYAYPFSSPSQFHL